MSCRLRSRRELRSKALVLLATLFLFRTTVDVHAACPHAGVSDDEDCTGAELTLLARDSHLAEYAGSSSTGPQIHRPFLRDVDFGVKQVIPDDVSIQHTQRVLRMLIDSLAYMERIRHDPAYDNVRDECVNHSEECTSWAAMGLCERNFPFTPLFCGPACRDCDVHDVEKRCPVDPDGFDSLGPGDLNALFERIMNHSGIRRRFRPRALSRPPHGPWVVELSDFLGSDECDRLIAHGHVAGYERSVENDPTQSGGSGDGVVTNGRTSSSAWCEKECEEDAEVHNVVERMSHAVDLPWDNAEYMHLLRYQPGEYYVEHHDYVPHESKRPYGVRVATAYLYLNDVPAGGGTRFPRLGNLTVYPEKGKMLLWANVLDEDPRLRDDRTVHEALPVESGEKYGANVWFHMRDFREPMQRYCNL
mmetsp:Transcript_50764/g.152871  ORF Transcript_50764/g.152871 Transcript_50764/m.152871 type:complete len:418 (-) Transcript_50764:79-1332(-)